MINGKNKGVVAVGLGVLAVGLVGGYALRMAHADGIPDQNVFTYAGVVENSEGVPLTGAHDLEVALYAAATGGTALCVGVAKSQNVVNGQFEVAMPGNCVAAVQGNKNAHVEVKVDGKVLPRSKVGAVPYAVEAGRAQEANKATTAEQANGASGALKTSLDQMNATLSAAAPKKDVPKMGEWTAYNPELRCGNVLVSGANSLGRWRRMGDSIEIGFGSSFNNTPPNCATGWHWTLPSGITINTAMIDPGGLSGSGIIYTNGTITSCIAIAQSSSQLIAQCAGTGGALVRQESVGVYNFTPGAGVSFRATLPVQGWTATSP